MLLAQREDCLAVLCVHDCTEGCVDSAKAAYQTNNTCDNANCVAACEVLDSKQEEQNYESTEDRLCSSVVLECSDEHSECVKTPEEQIEAHGYAVSISDACCGEGVDPDDDQRPPKHGVGYERCAGECVAVSEFEDARCELCKSAYSYAHRQDDNGQLSQTYVVQVEQDCSAAETEQSERAGV